jgi:cytochrome c biogenesis protein
MKAIKFKNSLKILTDLKFAIILLGIIAIISSLGSFIEQDEAFSFYEQNYQKPIFGFIDSTFLLSLGLDHVYTTWWFLSLLALLGICLISCTITRQFPLVENSQDYFFKRKKTSFVNLPFSIQIQNFYYLKEIILLKIQNQDFTIYQKGNFLYGYKGLIGRISPIFVHVSLILILIGSSIGAFFHLKAQEILPKGELFHIQNLIRVGWGTKIPVMNIRVNDFWVEYEKKEQQNRIHQFYSNLSIIDNYGNEIKNQTISVNNPLRYENMDFYQSDWNLIGIRCKETKSNEVYEFPLFPLKENAKSWITWIEEQSQEEKKENTKILVVDENKNTVNIYDETGIFETTKNIGDFISSNFLLTEILPSTGLLMKYDPSISFIYLGFGLLMITACLSYFPYTQIWIFNQKKSCWIGSSTNRGKIQLEIQFENLIRSLESQLTKSIFFKQKQQ